MGQTHRARLGLSLPLLAWWIIARGLWVLANRTSNYNTAVTGNSVTLALRMDQYDAITPVPPSKPQLRGSAK